MLGKSLNLSCEKLDFYSNFPVCDSHLHLVQCAKNEDVSSSPFKEYHCATCCHSIEEWNELLKIKCDYEAKKCFGFHPQMPLGEDEGFLKSLLEENSISAVGEAGFDFFTEEFKKNEANQEKAFLIELSLSLEYKKPLVIHERKALSKIYKFSSELKKLPSVLFHSFFYGIFEAKSILEKGINAYFSFGKQILNGNKKSIECVKNLPLEKLLLETDAPFQTLKGEVFTSPNEILKVYDEALKIRGVKGILETENFFVSLKNNFLNLYK